MVEAKDAKKRSGLEDSEHNSNKAWLGENQITLRCIVAKLLRKPPQHGTVDELCQRVNEYLLQRPEALAKVRGAQSPFGMLWKVAYNSWIQMFRETQRRARILESRCQELEDTLSVADAASTARVNEAMEHLRKVLGKSDLAILEYILEDCTYTNSQIAAALGWTYSKVAKRKFRLRKKLSELLETFINAS